VLPMHSLISAADLSEKLSQGDNGERRAILEILTKPCTRSHGQAADLDDGSIVFPFPIDLGKMRRPAEKG
jgi:hypothetical protein